MKTVILNAHLVGKPGAVELGALAGQRVEHKVVLRMRVDNGYVLLSGHAQRPDRSID